VNRRPSRRPRAPRTSLLPPNFPCFAAVPMPRLSPFGTMARQGSPLVVSLSRRSCRRVTITDSQRVLLITIWPTRTVGRSAIRWTPLGLATIDFWSIPIAIRPVQFTLCQSAAVAAFEPGESANGVIGTGMRCYDSNGRLQSRRSSVRTLPSGPA